MTCETWVAPAVERLDSMVDDGLYAVGAQLWVSHQGRVACDMALGDAVDGLMAPVTVHNNYCLGKPIMALAIGRLVADGLLDPTAPLAGLGLPDWAVPPFACSVLDVLDHQVGLDTLAAMEYRVTPAVVRPQLVSERIAAAVRRPAYSEILGGLILEEVIRACTGCGSVAAEVTRTVLEPLEATTIALDGEQARPLATAGLVSVPFGGLPDRRVPLLFELLDHSLADLRPAFGLLCSARDMGRVVEGVRRSLVPGAAEPVLPLDVLAMLLTVRHPPFDDARAMRRVEVTGGFMVDATVNSLARLASPHSFGHNAGMAQAVTFADIDHELTISLYLNGAEVGESSATLDRLALVDEVYRGLGVR